MTYRNYMLKNMNHPSPPKIIEFSEEVTIESLDFARCHVPAPQHRSWKDVRWDLPHSLGVGWAKPPKVVWTKLGS